MDQRKRFAGFPPDGNVRYKSIYLLVGENNLFCYYLLFVTFFFPFFFGGGAFVLPSRENASSPSDVFSAPKHMAKI